MAFNFLKNLRRKARPEVKRHPPMFRGRLRIYKARGHVVGVLMGAAPHHPKIVHVAKKKIEEPAAPAPETVVQTVEVKPAMKSPTEQGYALYQASMGTDTIARDFAVAKVALLRRMALGGNGRAQAIVSAFDDAPFAAQGATAAAISGAAETVKRECIAMAGYLPLTDLVGEDNARAARRIAYGLQARKPNAVKLWGEIQKRERRQPERYQDLAYGVRRCMRELKDQRRTAVSGGFDFGKFMGDVGKVAGPIAQSVAPLAKFVPFVGPVLEPALGVAGKAMAGDYDAQNKVKTIKKLADTGNPAAQRDMTALKVAAKIQRAAGIARTVKKARKDQARKDKRRAPAFKRFFLSLMPYRAGTRIQRRG